jgi:hypothetical protein
MDSMRRPSLRAVGAAIALLLAALLAATFTSTASAARAKRQTACNEVAALTPRSDDFTAVDVLRAKGLGCADARRVVTRCIAGTLGDDWDATSPELVTLLTAGRRQIAFRVLAGPQPACLKTAQPKGLGAGLQMARNSGEFGPYEGPLAYPNKWPSPSGLVYEWGDSPVATWAAGIKTGSVSSVRIGAHVKNSGEVRSVWFEWGRTKDTDRRTALQDPPTRANDEPVDVTDRLTHLKAGTRYYWQAVANVDTASGVRRFEGALGSFVTNKYPKIADKSRPCDSRPAGGLEQGQLFELTESLALDCSPPQHFEKGACFPACADFWSGRLQCNKDFPRNLNAGSWTFTVPRIDYLVTVDNLVSYWRSNNSNRFLEVSGKNTNSAGGEVGPTPGWHNWDVAQWAYPATPTSTDARFWIACTEQWGTVIDGDSLADGEGPTVPSLAEPGKPTDLKVKAAGEGIDVDWKAPSNDTPSGVAGYYMTIAGWKPSEAKTFPKTTSAPITAIRTEGRISPEFLSFYKKYLPAGQEIYVAVAAVSREGTVGDPAVVLWPTR